MWPVFSLLPSYLLYRQQAFVFIYYNEANENILNTLLCSVTVQVSSRAGSALRLLWSFSKLFLSLEDLACSLPLEKPVLTPASRLRVVLLQHFLSCTVQLSHLLGS